MVAMDPSEPDTTQREARDLAELTGPGRVDIVRMALLGIDSGPREPADLDVDLHLSVEVDRVHHRPGAGVSVGYRVGYDDGGGARVNEYLVASTAPRLPESERVALLADGDRQVRVWRHPHDPALPGLAPACDAATVHGWLTDLGRPPAAPVRLDLVSYRPSRRAVLRAGAGDDSVFVKVLPPRRAEALYRRHEVLTDAGVPTPRVLACPGPGVLMIERARGHALAEAIAGAERNPGGLPGPDVLEAWLDSLPATVLELPARPSWADRIDFHAEAARAALPAEAGRIDRLETGLTELLARTPDGPKVPTHGDFYEANVFTADGGVSSVIDVDSVGPGRRSDDLGTMLGHVAVLPALAPHVYAHVPGIVKEWTAYFETRVDPVDLRARTAAVVLSLAAGTSPEQGAARLAVAEEWHADAQGRI
ncbi:aminoglycoside phosphotransferase family protein [Occultella glacieicola]|uniref:Aminoglycoside phosphotransferase family protein n=1 Tax=Occultella glacieicola TaxID=2518684 RepID=A0ABY2DXD4_9MICO|nr:aminoglycoside phosphotransferase family protein [Occultella glacieicola]TDE88035.1 aminoglycoside phosphotransferase family protein [Occultella glacieicola]